VCFVHSGADLYVYLAIRDGSTSSVSQELLVQKLREAEPIIEGRAGVRVKGKAEFLNRPLLLHVC
jgi:hypothetical protein